MTGSAASTTASRAVRPRWIAVDALPEVLRTVPAPPRGLWILGDPSCLEGAPAAHVAIVGTREASPYGIRVAEAMAAACARAGLVVVSGLARGIDAAAHRAALDAGGTTVAVLGTGVDVPYPVGHRALHARIAGDGLVVSEMEPGTKAFPGCFPRRNRLIAALAKVVLVVEAGHRSGAINTASQALELGVTVAAVPGRIDDPASAGANQLIFDGAQMVLEPEDLLSLCGRPGLPRSDKPSTTAVSQVIVSDRGQALDLLAELPFGQAAREVLNREMAGLAGQGLYSNPPAKAPK